MRASSKHSLKIIALALLAAIIFGGGAYYLHALTNGQNTTKTATKSLPVTTTATPKKSTKPISAGGSIGHIFIIMMENRTYSSIVGNPSAPYLNSLIAHSALATNYFGVTHPSLPNYLAVTSGSTDSTTTDCNPPGAGCIVNVTNIADSIQNSGRTWKAYAEGMPSPCYMLNNLSTNFATKHVPFLYYNDIVSNNQRCDSHVVSYSQLATDLKSAQTTPNFAFITPNLCNDMHDCSTSVGDTWLSANVPIILNSPAFTSSPSLLVITWDEGNAADNHIATIFAGSAAKSGYQNSTAFNHYSLLHTIEYVWGLKPLTANDQNAPLMTSLLTKS
ncbi:alkaline phosphatase family protein [Patescibacteria group bacterium]|jgi:hypothetical protein|nr:alkaline phosphatase family protein [Patescibacteria group bacterium]